MASSIQQKTPDQYKMTGAAEKCVKKMCGDKTIRCVKMAGAAEKGLQLVWLFQKTVSQPDPGMRPCCSQAEAGEEE
jgi:hypothetical protein